MIKTIITKCTYIACALLFTAGCSDLKFGDAFLEKAPGVDVTLDTIFSSRMYAERELVGAYATLRTCLTVHANNGHYEFQNAGNKVAWDNLDSFTDIIQSHCTWGGAYGTFYSGLYDAELENDGYGKYGFNPDCDASWTGIRRAYIYINNVDRVPDMTDEEKRIRKGEARMIIALNMHELLRHFGGVPILYDYATPENDLTTDYSRKTFEETVNFIVGLCDQAAEELPWTVSEADNGRMTKAGAMALKIRVLSFAASPCFNADRPYLDMPEPTAANADKITVDYRHMVWYGNYSEQRWQDVITACEEFFRENEKNGNVYRLQAPATNDAEGYREAFSSCYADRTSPEILIHTGRAIPYFGDTYHKNYFGLTDENGAGRGYGGGCVTLNYVDKFQNIDGTRSDYARWIEQNGNIGTLDNNPFTGKDPRLYETVLIAGDRYRNRVAETWTDGLEHGSASNPKAATGFIIRKFLWDYNDEFFSKATNSAYIRLPEIYLIYAEALNEVGRSTEALEYLDKTRTRVGLPKMTMDMLAQLHSVEDLPAYPECQLQGNPLLREEILDERAREFCFEEVRWFDIVRWKRDDIFKTPLYAVTIEIESGDYETGDLRLSYSQPRVDDIPRAWSTDFNRKWYMSAFPSDEVNKGYGLVQNPGW